MKLWFFNLWFMELWFFNSRAQMDVYIKREFFWLATTPFMRSKHVRWNWCKYRFPYKTCYFWLKQIFVGLFVVLPEMNIRKVIKGFSGKHTEFLNHYWLMLFRKIPANCKDTLLWKDQVCSWDFSKKCLHSRSLK